LVDQSIPPIWTEHGFNRNVVTGTGFGYVSPGTFQTRRAAVADKVKIKLHTANIRHAVWIVVNAAEAVAEGTCRQDSGWLATVSHDASMAVLDKSADGFGGVHDFECVQWRSQRGHDSGLGHWKIDRSELHQRVTAGQEVGRIHVGHGASGGDIHIATHQDGA